MAHTRLRPHVRFGSLADISQCNRHARFAPVCGRLLVGKSFLHICSSIGRCARVFGLLARHTWAGHNALRGSGPKRKPAFDNAWG